MPNADNKAFSFQNDDKDIVCTPEKKPTNTKLYVHSLIGIAIMVVFQFLPAMGGITPIGMKMVGAFLGMVYLWSLVDTMWPSLLGLIFMGFSGFAGEGAEGMINTMLNAFGQHTVLLTLFCMVLFGALYESGCTNYIANWFLTRKIITGRPYVFVGIFYAACYLLSTLISPISSLLVMWPIALSLMEELKIELCDKFWPYFFVGMFFVSTIGQPLFPFMGAQLIVVSAFQSMSGMAVPYGQYMALNLIMCFLLGLVYILVLKYIIRPDVSKLKAVNAEKIAAQNTLPPMNAQQKAFLIMLPIYIVLLLMPSFLPKTFPLVPTLTALGPLGVTIVFVIFFSIIRFGSGPFLNFKEVAYGQLSWGIYFMIAAAVYGANGLSADSTGVKTFLLSALNPILGGRSEMAFVAIMFTVALIITNFANNAAMAVVLMPVILAFSEQMGIEPMPVAMGVGMMVFVAMLTPAASPHAGMMHGRKDIYTTGDIMRIGFPQCIATLIFYIFIGYPLAKLLFA
ncbi:SLC13 family permease [Peptococcus simiae]|uniref:SLC13 family permease n=1 Tax=Peptococcus simiae TaxID=1643805 RepID=UPI0039807560